MNLTKLKSIFAATGCSRIFVKTLSANDNSKNQVYLGGSFDILNIFPISEIRAEEAGDWNKERFKAALNFSWLTDEGEIVPAPNSQLILYPKYPEVRFSGFLAGCANPPSELMSQRLPGRLLFIGVTNLKTLIGYVAAPDAEITNETNKVVLDNTHGVFRVIILPLALNSRQKLIEELRRISEQGWIRSKRLNAQGEIISCEAPQCGGYTLEAELGIIPNGRAEPDFLDWEIKNFSVTNFEKFKSKIITLMTPEPTGGYYKQEGLLGFVKKYGYADISGKADRKNFGGIYKSSIKNKRTKIELKLIGYDPNEEKIRNTEGCIALIDEEGNNAASWSFSSLLLHWNKKHNQACFVPSQVLKIPERKYKYGKKIILGVGTNFQLFLSQMASGNIYYDPAMKVENISTKPKAKPRSQFRIKAEFIPNIYKSSEIIDVTME